ncbi:MAG: 16S rRNA processing protein RimM [Spirochaetia bacterium]|nr:16S rRNA processing protein RimM [Spirochaetia bacterium]
MQYIATGVLRGPHGLKGSIKLKSFSGEVAHLLDIKKVQLRHGTEVRLFEVDEVITHGDELLIRFRGIDSPEKARTLNGWELWVDREDAAPLEQGEYYSADLMDSSIIVEGEVVGKVVAILDGPQALLLEVKHSVGEKTSLIPFMAPFIGFVHTHEKEIELLEKELLS